MDSAEILGRLVLGRRQRESEELDKDEREAASSLTNLHEAYAVFDRTLTDYPENARNCMRRELLHGVRRVRKIQRSKGVAPWKASCIHVGLAYDCHLSKLHAKYAGTSKRRRPNCDPTKAALALKKTISRGKGDSSAIVAPIALHAKRSANAAADRFAALSQPTRAERRAAQQEQERQRRLEELQREEQRRRQQERQQQEEMYLREEQRRRQREEEELFLYRQREEELYLRRQQEQRYLALQQEEQRQQQDLFMPHQRQPQPYARVPFLEAPLLARPQPHAHQAAYQAPYARPLSPPGFAHLLRPQVGGVATAAHHMALPVPGVVGGGLPVPDRSWGPGSVYA